MKSKRCILGVAMISPMVALAPCAAADTLRPSAVSVFSKAIPPEDASPESSSFAPATTMPVRSSATVFGTAPVPVRLAAVVPAPVRQAVQSVTGARDRSLAAAVSRIESGDVRLDGQGTCVAQAVYYESRGEPVAGQKAVADVIVNRTRRPGFASSPCGVVRQKGQFTNAARWRVPAATDPLWRRAKAVASLAVGGLWSISDSITHFHASGINPGWNARRIAAIGHHVFYGR